MSYCRAGINSDIYLIATGDGLRCYCNRPGNESNSRQAMVDHLLGHRASGDNVPQYAIERLLEEIIDEGDTYPNG